MKRFLTGLLEWRDDTHKRKDWRQGERRGLSHNTAAAQHNRPFFQLAPQHSSQLSPSRYSPAVHPTPSPSLPFLIWGGGGLKMNSGQAHAVPGVISGKPCKTAQKMEAFSSGREAEGSEMHKVVTNGGLVVVGRGKHTTNTHTSIRHHHRRTSQPIHVTHKSVNAQSEISTCLRILCLFAYLFIPPPTPLPSWSPKLRRCSREKVNVTELPPCRHGAPATAPATLFHRNIQRDRSSGLNSAFPPSSRRNRPWIIQLYVGEC